MSNQSVVAARPSAAEAVRGIVEVGRYLSARDLVPATSGNFSTRVEGSVIAITASGVDKGELTESDILVYDLDGPAPGNASAETALHAALYRDRPDVGAVLHTHSITSVLLSQALESDGRLVLSGYEMMKAIQGVRTHETTLVLPIVANSQDVPALAQVVAGRLAAEPAAPGYLLAGHGLYTWGRTLAEARRHVVALEYLMTCEIEKRRMAR